MPHDHDSSDSNDAHERNDGDHDGETIDEQLQDDADAGAEAFGFDEHAPAEPSNAENAAALQAMRTAALQLRDADPVELASQVFETFGPDDAAAAGLLAAVFQIAAGGRPTVAADEYDVDPETFSRGAANAMQAAYAAGLRSCILDAITRDLRATSVSFGPSGNLRAVLAEQAARVQETEEILAELFPGARGAGLMRR